MILQFAAQIVCSKDSTFGRTVLINAQKGISVCISRRSIWFHYSDLEADLERLLLGGEPERLLLRDIDR